MSWKILVNDGMEEEGILALRAFGFEVDGEPISQEHLKSKLQNYDGIIVRSATKVRKDLIEICPNLKFIARGGVGMDNIDVEYAKSKNIQVINTPAASSRSVAELAMAHILSCTRGLFISSRELNSDENFVKLKKQMSSFQEVKSKKLFLIGFGRIGRELSKMALGAEMEVIVHDPYIKIAEIELDIMGKKFNVNLPLVDLDEGLQQADYISIHTPFSGNPILSKREFGLMKKNVILINTSRGENIDESTLIEALESGKVQAAGLDVFQNEPNISPSILKQRNVGVTPHIGASTKEAQARIAIELVEKIKDCFNNHQ
ncbi:MAG: NAD(P)-dependent oxidoreductase [Saprospiraceae bacterium]